MPRNQFAGGNEAESPGRPFGLLIRPLRFWLPSEELRPSIAVARVMTKWSPRSPAIFTIAALSAALTGWVSIADGRFQLQVLLGSLLLWTIVGGLGTCLLSYLIRDAKNIDPVIAILVGYFATSIVLFVGTVVLHWDILVGLSICAGLVALLAYRTRAESPFRRLSFERLDGATLAIAIVFATLWSRQNLTGLVQSSNTVVSTPWLDTLYHAIHVSHFANGSGQVLTTDPLLATSPLAPYHYAGYMLPSLMVRVAGISSYLAIVGHFAPLGTLFTGLAAYATGRILCGSLGGFLAAALCLAVPDPTFYLLENRWMSYFFFQQIAASGAFGASLMAIAWAFCLLGVIRQNRRYTVFGLAAAACVVVFKSQIFLAYSFGLALFAAATFPRLASHLRVALGSVVSLVFAGCVFLLLPAMPRAPTFIFGTSAGPMNLHFALSNIGGPCQTCIPELARRYPLFLAVAIPAFLVLTFGLMLPLFALLSNARRVRRSLPPGASWFLWTAVIGFLLIALGLDKNSGHGDPFEIAHKTFVWPYLALAIWCGAALSSWIVARKWLTRRVILIAVVPLGLIGLGKLVYQCAGQLQTGFVYVGSETSSRLAMSRDSYDIAMFIRQQTASDAIVQLGVTQPNLMFAAISERRTFVSYPQNSRNAPAPTALAHSSLTSILSAQSVEDFRALARQCHIDYFVLCPGQQPTWASATRPIFARGEYRVYRI